MLNRITPLILTYNEEANIERTLNALYWATRVVVIDSGSDDNTVSICQQFKQVEVFEHVFIDHASQWNFGLSKIGTGEWVLALDADHIVTSEYTNEVEQLAPADSIGGYRNGFVYWQNAKPLKGSLYPPLVALFRRLQAHYIQDGHTQRVVVEGEIKELRAKNRHDDRKPLSRWVSAQKRYAQLEAQKLSSTPWGELRWSERARLTPYLSPFLVLFYTLVVKRLVLSGRAGIQYALQRTWAEIFLHNARVKQWLDPASDKP